DIGRSRAAGDAVPLGDVHPLAPVGGRTARRAGRGTRNRLRGDARGGAAPGQRLSRGRPRAARGGGAGVHRPRGPAARRGRGGGVGAGVFARFAVGGGGAGG